MLISRERLFEMADSKERERESTHNAAFGIFKDSSRPRPLLLLYI